MSLEINQQTNNFQLSENQKGDLVSRMRFSWLIWGGYFGFAFLFQLFQYLTYPDLYFKISGILDVPNYQIIFSILGLFLFVLAILIKKFMLAFTGTSFQTKKDITEIDLDPYLKKYEGALMYSQSAGTGLIFTSILFLNANNLSFFYFSFGLSLLLNLFLKPSYNEIEALILKDKNPKF